VDEPVTVFVGSSGELN
jgi:hypothetical protein